MSDEAPRSAGQDNEPPYGSLARRPDSIPELPFGDLEAPAPIDSAPPTSVRWIAFIGIVVGGLLGALVGYGIGDILYPGSLGPAAGVLLGGLTAAGGVGVLANLTLRAMNEWNVAPHPEANNRTDNSTRISRAADRHWSRRSSA